ncbi:hypothetical protein JCM11641_004689 [Rhodosporidiobolus odoratus]
MSFLTIEHLPLAGYFALIGYLLFTIAPSLTRRKPSPITLVFFLLALASVGSTWLYMLAYFKRSFADAALRAGVAVQDYSTQAWLRDVSLFKEAWEYVCSTPQRWWWSEQLCLWTVGPLTLLMAVEGRRHRIKSLCAYMLLGQVVAISFAQSLFFLALSVAPSLPAKVAPTPAPAKSGTAQPLITRKPPSSLTWWLLAAVILGNASVAFAPRTLFSSLFLPNLLLMHAVLVLPLVLRDNKSAPMTLSRFYMNVSIVALRFRWPTLLEIIGKESDLSLQKLVPRIPQLLEQQWVILNEHPAQQSIGWDVIFTSISALVYLGTGRSPRRADERLSYIVLTLVVLATPLVGVSSTVGMGLAIREGRKEAREDAERKLDETRRAQAVERMATLGGEANNKRQ